MIVRILGEGQFTFDDSGIAAINTLDDELQRAAEANDDAAFAAALDALVAEIKRIGSPLPADDLHPSDAVVPAAGTTLDEVGELLGSEGLIPD